MIGKTLNSAIFFRLLAALSLLTLAFIALPANAADKAGPAVRDKFDDPAPKRRMFGCYGDVGVGVGATLAEFTSVDSVEETTSRIPITPTGFLGTVGAGCDAFFGGITLGAFANYNFGELKSDFLIDDEKVQLGLKNAYVIGGRIGYNVTPTLMAFGRVAYASADVELTAPDGKAKKDLKGILVGAGIEQDLFASTALRLTIDYTMWDNEKFEDTKAEGATVVGGMAIVYKF